MSQTLKVTDLNNNRGLIPIKMGQARVINSYKRIIHVIEIQFYDENLRVIKSNIDIVKETVNSNIDYKNTFKNKIEILEHKFKELQDNVNLLKPTRIKRGLINGLGSLIKDITGNLDQHDLEEISLAIHNLHQNQNNLNKENNAQIEINKSMIDRFNYVQKYVKDSNKKITFELNRLNNITQTGMHIIKIDQYIFKLINTIDTLTQHIDDILDALSSARHRRISRHLLSNNEIHFINDLLHHNQIEIINPNNIYDLLTLQGYYNQTRIILSIQVPTFYETIFSYFKIKPIPSKNLMITPIPSYNIILNEHNYYQYILQPCNELENTYYCTKQSLQSISNTCIPSIISQQPAQCNHTVYELDDEVSEIITGKLYVATPGELEFTSTCQQLMKSIKGQALIEFDNCNVNISGVTYSSMKYVYQEDQIVIIPYHDVISQNVIQSLSTSQMTNWTIQHRDHITLLQERALSHSIQGYSTTTLIVITIIAIIIYGIWKRCYKSKSVQDNPQPATEPKPIRRKSLWPSLRREELRSSTQLNA